MADFSCAFTPTMYTVAGMIFSGLFDRHRKLKVLSVENDAAWPLGILERMDDRYEHDKLWAATANFITSGRKPSEIFHEHVAATFMRDRTAILNREIIGRDNIMWGSDYPAFRRRLAGQRRRSRVAVRGRAARGSAAHRPDQRDQILRSAAGAIALAATVMTEPSLLQGWERGGNDALSIVTDERRRPCGTIGPPRKRSAIAG